MLQAQGFTVVSIPSWQWKELSSPSQQRSYLAGQLKQHALHS